MTSLVVQFGHIWSSTRALTADPQPLECRALVVSCVFWKWIPYPGSGKPLLVRGRFYIKTTHPVCFPWSHGSLESRPKDWSVFLDLFWFRAQSGEPRAEGQQIQPNETTGVTRRVASPAAVSLSASSRVAPIRQWVERRPVRPSGWRSGVGRRRDQVTHPVGGSEIR